MAHRFRRIREFGEARARHVEWNDSDGSECEVAIVGLSGTIFGH